jgi:heme A synthase
MGWITRRIAGSITFVIVSAILGAWAVATGHLSGEPTLSTAWGAGILGVAFLVSLAVTHRMKVREKTRKAWEEYYRAWQDYYARLYATQPRSR